MSRCLDTFPRCFADLFLYLANAAEGRLISPSAKSGTPLGSSGDELIAVEIPDAEEIRLPAIGFGEPPAMGDHDDLGMNRRCHHGLPLNSPSPVFDIDPFPVVNPQVSRCLRVDLNDRVGIDLSHPGNHPMLRMEVDR